MSLETPTLFTEKEFSATTLAHTVNHYIALGEMTAMRELEVLGRGEVLGRAQASKDEDGIAIDQRIGWICRILFLPKSGSLWPPSDGCLFPADRTNAVDWPLYPLAKSGTTFCVLSEMSACFGYRAPIAYYLTYCQENGVFRSCPVPLPTRSSAIADLKQLRQSKRWQEIQWDFASPGRSYSCNESWFWSFIIKQGESIGKIE